MCTCGRTRWNTSFQARRREEDEAGSWSKHKESPVKWMSQKTRSYPSLGEGWDLRVGPSGQCHWSPCPIVWQKQAQFWARLLWIHLAGARTSADWIIQDQPRGHFFLQLRAISTCLKEEPACIKDAQCTSHCAQRVIYFVSFHPYSTP